MDRAHRLTKWLRVAAVLLVLGFTAAAGTQAWRDSATFDEPVYLSAGTAALLQHDVTLNPEHPPLFKAIAALSVLFTHPASPAVARTADEWTYSASFLRAQVAAGTWHRVVFAGRLVPIGEALLCAWLIFLLGRRFVGASAGLLAATLWLSAPLVIGLGHLDGVDLPFAVTTLATALALVHWLGNRTRRHLIVVGLAVGTAVASQLTGLLLVAFVSVWVLRSERTWRRGIGSATLVIVLAWLTLWCSYLVLNPAQSLHAEWALPTPFVTGIRFLSTNDSLSGVGYLLGHFWTGGRWWYWPISLLIKTAIPTFIAIVAGAVLWRRVPKDRRAGALGVVLLPIVVLTLPLLADPRDIGVRYLLPQFALLTVAAAPVVLVCRARIGRAFLATGVAGALGAGALSIPHSLSYSSAPFSPAYRNLSDSSVDWGQDLGLLQSWAVGKTSYVSYFGPRGTSAADVPGASELVGVPPAQVTGWVAVSATNLNSNARASLGWLRKYCPIQTLGGTILIYHFSAPPTNDPGPALPPGVCAQ